MKSFFALALLFFSIPTFGQVANKPFFLNPGIYSMECFGATVRGDQSNNLTRTMNYQKGTDVVSIVNDSVVEKFDFYSDDGTQHKSMTRTTTNQDLGSGLYVQTVRDTVDGGRDAVFVAKLKIEGTSNQVLSSTMNGVPMNISGKELMWQILIDKRIIVHDYFLGKYLADAPTSHSYGLCIFTPKN